MKYAVLTSICAAIALFLLRSAALKVNWLDHPDARKVHSEPVPAIGGLAWMAALIGGLALAGYVSTTPHLIGALILIALLGAVDDRFPLPSIPRLLVQSLAVVIAFWDSPILSHFGELFWPGSPVHAGVLAWPITVFAGVGVINAINMIDGMDGALGLLCLLILAVLLAGYYDAGLSQHALLIGLSISALIPFLCLNARTPWMRKAKVFFGDAGSMSMGLLLTWLVVIGSQPGSGAANLTDTVIGASTFTVFAPVSALYLLAVPLLDTVSLMLRRIQRGRSPFKPDQDHLHHLLQRAGYTVTQALAIMLLAALAMISIGGLMKAMNVPESVQLLVFLLLALVYHFWVASCVRERRWFGRALADRLADVGL
jgi:UDP-GlcNAc:undecaprenyl-phosphate/decaprenyl-phosphate GlcNAc-1-phosphate transferase